MKTILEWYQELPEPYRKQAIENCDKDLINTVGLDMLDAIRYGFEWHKSPQGNNYWEQLFENYE